MVALVSIYGHYAVEVSVLPINYPCNANPGSAPNSFIKSNLCPIIQDRVYFV